MMFVQVACNVARKSALRIVIVQVCFPFAVSYCSTKRNFGTNGVNICIFAYGSSVVSYCTVGIDTLVAELVTTVGVDIFYTGRTAGTSSDFLLPQQSRICQPERAG